MIRIDLPDLSTGDRVVEALYVAAGQRPGTSQANEWRAIAADLETAIDLVSPEDALADRHLRAVNDGAA
ncbi:hypothetical protein ACFVFJ_44555 [Streptomyces sp. NPDC057717]|uniref:hypothetical protein n=1 Tax=Streptomyces sp. NPDC057717 TaxID=3346224 RepID=UPI00368BED3B